MKLAVPVTASDHAQGKFWEMHDALFENQRRLGQPLLETLVEQLGLDAARFEADLESRRFLPRVKRDFEGGVRGGVDGTPGFFINGVRYTSSWDPESLGAALLRAASA